MRECLTHAPLPHLTEPALPSIAIWEAILSSLALRRELKRAGPKTDKSKVGRTSRKLPADTGPWVFDSFGHAYSSYLK